jgi:hypothetical protein
MSSPSMRRIVSHRLPWTELSMRKAAGILLWTLLLFPLESIVFT